MNNSFVDMLAAVVALCIILVILSVTFITGYNHGNDDFRRKLNDIGYDVQRISSSTGTTYRIIEYVRK